MKKQAKVEPVFKSRSGAVSLAVWENKGDNDNVWYSVTMERGYKDAQGVWQSTHSLGTNDIPKAIVCLQEAYKYITMGLPDD